MRDNFIVKLTVIRKAIFRLLLLCVFALTGATTFAGIPTPEIQKGKGDKCVEDTDFMRRNHMEVILHQRKETVYKGIRTKQHSLKGCINCHAVNGDDNVPVSFKNPKHFCNSCHTYAAVKMDCFECHASRPNNNKLYRSNFNKDAMSKHP